MAEGLAEGLSEGLVDEINRLDTPVSPPHAPPPVVSERLCSPERKGSPPRSSPVVVYSSNELAPLVLPQPPGTDMEIPSQPPPGPGPQVTPAVIQRDKRPTAAASARSTSTPSTKIRKKKPAEQIPNSRLYQRQPLTTKSTARSVSSAARSTGGHELMRELGSELNVANEKLSMTRNSLESSQKTNSLMVGKLKEAHERISTLEQLREQDRSKWLETVASWKVHLEQADNKSKKERETLELRMSAYEHSIEHSGVLSGATERAEMRTAVLEKELQEVKSELRARMQHTQEAIQEAEDIKRNQIVTSTEYTAAVDQSTLLQSMVTSLRTELSKTDMERAAYEERINALHMEIETLTQHNAELSQDLVAQKENDSLLLQQATNDYKAEIGSLTMDMELKLAAQKEEARNRYNLYEDENNGLRHEMATAAHKYETETAKLQADFEERLLKLHNQKQTEKQNDNSMILALRGEIQTLELKCQDTDAFLEAVQAEYDGKLLEKTKEVNAKTALITNLKQEVQNAVYDKQLTTRNVAFLEEQMQKLEVRVREDDSKIHQQERLLATSTEREGHLRKQLDGYTAQVGLLQGKLAEAATEAEHLAVQHTQALRKNDYLKNSLATAENQAKRVGNESERLRADLIMKDVHLEDLRAKHVQQQVELQQSKIKLVEATFSGPRVPSHSPYRHPATPTPPYTQTMGTPIPVPAPAQAAEAPQSDQPEEEELVESSET